MTSKMPSTGSLEGIVAFMKSDEKLKFFTESYRQTGNKSFKQEAPLFAVACRFEGGKGKDNVKESTKLSLVDFDHVFDESHTDLADLNSEKLNTNFSNNTNLSTLEAQRELKRKICEDAHTLLCYITMSGNGLRIIYRYEGDDYLAAFNMGNDYYERLAGKESDRKCKNITRLSGLAYDPEVYYNPQAVAFNAEEIARFHVATQQQSQKRKKLDRINTYFEQVIKPRLASADVKYEPGNHNQYVMRVGYMLAQKRYAQANAIEWGLQKFPEYDGVEQVFTSCYANTSQPKQPDRKPSVPFASCETIKSLLKSLIKLRYNLISTRYEFLKIRDANAKSKNGEKWQNLEDRGINSLWTQMSTNYRVNKSDLINVIESDFTPVFHPFQEYLAHLPPWHEGDTDYIAELAATVKVKTNAQDILPFEESLKKWLVGMIAGWIDEEAVNNVIMVFIGRQGANKTTWFNCLLPPELKKYFYTKTNAKRMTKDDLIALSQYALICCEELDTMSPSELNQLKAAVTMQYVNERPAYAHYSEQRKHISTFCGTGNTTEFLNDPTGNRRWLPFEIESILSPREHPFNHPGIYAQAYALYQSGFRYWFTDAEIELQNQHNRTFEAPHLERELVDLYFRKPTETENGEFVSVARAMQLISCNISQKLSSMKISKAFVDLGFKRVRTSHSRGFIAIIRTAEQIKAYQISLGLDADGDLPF